MSGGLHQLTQQIHAVLRGEVQPEEAADALGVDPDRLAIYRDFVAQHVRKALEKLYPMVRALVGEQRWDQLVSRFFTEVPSASWELNACAEPFAAMLDRMVGEEQASVDAFLVNLAQFEWEEFYAYVNPAGFAESGRSEGPTVNPTLAILRFDYPIVPFVVAHPDPESLGPDTRRPERLAEPELALVFRRPDGRRIGYYQGTDDLLFALKVSFEGLDLEQAAAQASQPLDAARAAIDHALEIGLLVQ